MQFHGWEHDEAIGLVLDGPVGRRFPKGDPPRTVTVEISDNEFAFIVPYNDYEVKIDRHSGLVLTRSNRRIWAENGTCTPAKANQ